MNVFVVSSCKNENGKITELGSYSLLFSQYNFQRFEHFIPSSILPTCWHWRFSVRFLGTTWCRLGCFFTKLCHIVQTKENLHSKCF